MVAESKQTKNESDITANDSCRIEILERRLEAVADRLRIKDEHVAALQEANRGLMDQFRSRWSGPQLAMSAMTAVFVLTFGYQLVKATELERIHTQSDRALDALQAVSKELVEGTQCQASILASLAEGIELTSHGQRKISQERVTEGLADVNEGLSSLEKASALLEALKAKRNERQSIKKEEDPAAFAITAADLALPLERAIKNAIFFAKGTIAAGRFVTKEYSLVADVGESLIALDPLAWEGYHFRALGTVHRTKSLALPIADYERSVQLHGPVNIDNLNLAELLFTNGDYDRALEYAERFLAADPHPQDVQRQAAEFYRAASKRARSLISGEEFELVLEKTVRLQAKKEIWAWDVLSDFVREPLPPPFIKHEMSLRQLIEARSN